MKHLIRSVIRCAHGDDPELFQKNYLALKGSGLEFPVAEDNALFEAVVDFYATHGHVPLQSTLTDRLKRAKETEVIDRLEGLSALPSITQGDFQSQVDIELDKRGSLKFREIMKEAATIADIGIKVKEGREEKILRGYQDAFHHIMNLGHDLLAPSAGQQLSGVANKDGAGLRDHYDKVESEGTSLGYPCGIEQMDEPLGGAKRFELWLHTAFTGHMKSTLMVNWAYTQAVYYKNSSVIFSLEMPYIQVRNWINALHTFHPKFRDLRVKLGIQKAPQGSGDGKYHDVSDCGLSYTKIRDAELSEVEKDFFFNQVVPDFENQDNNYGEIHVEVPDPDKADTTVIDIKMRAEIIYTKSPFSVLFIDHLGLVSSRRWVPSTTERLNEVIRDTKRLAMNFNRGMGIAIVGLFQLNREGFKAAMKNGGKYDLTNLAYANEAERSADIVTAAWLDDNLRKAKAIFLQCMKSRDQAPFEDFYAGFVDCCRRILTCDLDIDDISKEWSQTEKKTKADKFIDEDVGKMIDNLDL